MSFARDAGEPLSLEVADTTRIEAYGADAHLELLTALRAHVLLCNAAEAQVPGLARDPPPWARELVLVHAGPRPPRVLTRPGVAKVVPV